VTASSLLLAARAEPGQGNPAATADALTKIDNLHKNWRNEKRETATEFQLYNDAGDTVDQKATVSDTGITTKGKMVSGP